MRRTLAGLAVLAASALGLSACGGGANETEPDTEPTVEEVVTEEDSAEAKKADDADSKKAAEKAAKGKPLSREEACAVLAGENDDVDIDAFDLDELDEMLEDVLGDSDNFEEVIEKAKVGVRSINNDEVANAMIKVLDAQAPFMNAMAEAFSTGDFDNLAVEEASEQFEKSLEELFKVCPNLEDLE